MPEISALLKENMLDYSAAVNQARAIPDARTGMKPIHRKVIYEMYADKIKSSGKYKKCAYMVGQIIARFSEHGDAATYDALVRLAQPWIQRYPLLDFHGNYGSPFGDDQAAMRYTEAKLSALTEDGLLATLDKQTVDWVPNFTNEEMEPSTLPAIFPGLFCLPNQGIGYGCACNFLTYNLDDVAKAISKYVRMNIFDNDLYYDLASGGTIINPQVMKQIHETGKGNVVIESKYTVEDNKIIITELPFNVMFDDVVDEIIKLCNKEDEADFNAITNIVNNSGDSKMELVIECQDAESVDPTLEALFNKTKLRTFAAVQQMALVDGKPKMLTTKDMMDIYIKHNCNCIYREYFYEMSKALDRIHILEGLLIAVNDIDNVIYIIRNSNNVSSELQQKYSLDEKQIKAILDMKLSRLSKLEIEKIKKELQEKQEKVKECKKVIDSPQEQKIIMLSRLDDLSKKYYSERRTAIVEKEISQVAAVSKKLVKGYGKPDNVLLSLNQDGYFKATRLTDSYRNVTEHNIGYFKATVEDYILVFTNLGRFFKIKADSFPMGKRTDKGTALGKLVKLLPEEIPLLMTRLGDDSVDYILFVTKKGIAKKFAMRDFPLTQQQNLKGSDILLLGEGDKIVSAVTGTDIENIFITTTGGYCVRCASDDISYQGQKTRGITAISLRENDQVANAICCNEDDDFAVIGYGGNCKLVKQNEFALQSRGGRGGRISGEPITKILQVKENDTLRLVTSNGILSLRVKDMPTENRYSYGKVMCQSKIIDVFK